MWILYKKRHLLLYGCHTPFICSPHTTNTIQPHTHINVVVVVAIGGVCTCTYRRYACMGESTDKHHALMWMCMRERVNVYIFKATTEIWQLRVFGIHIVGNWLCYKYIWCDGSRQICKQIYQTPAEFRRYSLNLFPNSTGKFYVEIWWMGKMP